MDVFSASIRPGIQNSDRETHMVSNIDHRNESMRLDPLLMRIQGVARIHVSSRPLALMGTASPHFMVSCASKCSILAQRRVQKRCISSNKFEGDKKTPDQGDKKAPETDQGAAADQEPGRLSSIVRSVGPTLRKVTEWNVPDLLSVYAVVILIALIMFSPYMVA